MAESPPTQAFKKTTKDHMLLEVFRKLYLEPISPEKCHAKGKGLEVAKLGERATALVHVVDTHGKACTDHPMGRLICKLVSESTGEKIDCSVKKTGAIGQYDISYQAARRGRHQLHIKVVGEHIIGSPFTVFVKLPLEKLGTPIKTITGIDQPWGVAISSTGKIIVTESHRNLVLIFNPEWENFQSVRSQGSSLGQFNRPRGVAVDDEDNILVVDCFNNRIQKFTSDGKFLAAADNLGLNFPTGVAIHPHSKQLFVANSNNNSIKILKPDLKFSSSFGSRGSGDGELMSPLDVAFDSTGKVYVADYLNHRIQVFTAEGEYLRQIGSKGSGKGELYSPVSISIDRQDVLYVAEEGNNRISLFKCDGQFLTSFGSYGSFPGRFHQPHGVAVDKDENIYVSDFFNNRVQVF